MNEELLRKVYDARNNAQELLPPLKGLLHRLSDLREQNRRKKAVELLEQLGNAVNELITYSLFGCQQVGGVDTLLSKAGAMVANGTLMVAGLVGNRKYYDPEDGAMNKPYSIRAIFDLMNSLSKELRRWAKEKTKASESAQGTAKAKAGNTTAPTASTHQKARQELSEEEKDKLLRGHRKKLGMLVRRGIMKADYSCADGVEKELYAFCVGVVWCGDKISKGSITISTTALPSGLKELLRFGYLSQYRSKLQGKKKSKNYTQIFRELSD